MTEVEKIRANAELVLEMIRKLTGPEAGYTAESVDWLDGHINRMREVAREPDKRRKLIGMHASFLGECIVRCYRGNWQHDEENGWAVVVGTESEVKSFPFAKVAKQWDNGPEDSIHSFFTTIPILQDHLEKEGKFMKKRPWWKFW